MGDETLCVLCGHADPHDMWGCTAAVQRETYVVLCECTAAPPAPRPADGSES